MNIPREKLCFYSSMFKGRSSATEIIQCAHRFGVGGVELMNFCDELSEPNINIARQLARTARMYALTLPCFSVGIDIISDPDSAMRLLRGYADICSEAEIPYLHHTVALNFTSGDVSPTERERRFDIGSFYALELAEYANKRGVRTLIEDQGFVFNGTENCSRLCKLSEGRIGIVADVGNILFYDESPADFIRSVNADICHCHIKDYYFSKTKTDESFVYKTKNSHYLADAEIGLGAVDLDSVESAFHDIGYSGMYSLEFAAKTDGLAEVDRVIKRFCS